MKDFFKYIPHSVDDEAWGLYLNVAGCAAIGKNKAYPPTGHPSGYSFSWEQGRVLHEYQILYISHGAGELETKDNTYPIEAGSVIVLQPNQWHRYRPIGTSGWQEQYVGFNGQYAENIFKLQSQHLSHPVIHIGYHGKIYDSFYSILEVVKEERPGYHQICSGLVIYILGQILALKKTASFNNRRVELYIQKACLKIRENLLVNINVEDLASEFDISYSLFRKEFKNYTGLSPIQYHQSLRIQQAIDLLTNTDKSIKEISYNLGFCSEFYFSKLFKARVGMPPSVYLSSRVKSRSEVEI